MKKFATAALAVVLVLAMTVCVFAAPSVSRFPFVPGVTIPDSPVSTTVQKAVVTDANGNAVSLSPVDITIKEADKTSADEVNKAANDLTTLAADLVDELPTGVTAGDLTVKEVFDVELSSTAKALIADGGSVRINFIVPGVKKGDFVVALHKAADGWEALPASAVGLNNVAVTMESFSPVAIVTLKGVKVDGSVTSPSTGMEVADVAHGVVAACVAAL